MAGLGPTGVDSEFACRADVEAPPAFDAPLLQYTRLPQVSAPSTGGNANRSARRRRPNDFSGFEFRLASRLLSQLSNRLARKAKVEPSIQTPSTGASVAE